MKTKYQRNATIFKAFCDENRWRILEMLMSGERCACELLEELNVGQSTLSHHMRILCESGVVASRREGKWTHYSINAEKCGEIVGLLRELLCDETTCKCC